MEELIASFAKAWMFLAVAKSLESITTSLSRLNNSFVKFK
jgi:hypothetical protein